MTKFSIKLQAFALAATLLSIPLAHAATDTNQAQASQTSIAPLEQQTKITSWADYAQKKAALKAQKKSKAITKAEFKEKKKELKMAYKSYKKEQKEEYKAKKKALKEERKAKKKALKEKMKAEKMEKESKGKEQPVAKAS